MILILTFEDLPPMPRNRSHMLTGSGKRPMNIKTPLCREFEKDLEHRLSSYSVEMEEFKKSFNPKIHCIAAEYQVYAPSELLFTADNCISSRCPDFDSNKALTDCVFEVLLLDDKLIKKFSISYQESLSGNWDWVLIFTLCPLSDLRSLL